MDTHSHLGERLGLRASHRLVRRGEQQRAAGNRAGYSGRETQPHGAGARVSAAAAGSRSRAIAEQLRILCAHGFPMVWSTVWTAAAAAFPGGERRADFLNW